MSEITAAKLPAQAIDVGTSEDEQDPFLTDVG